MFTYFLKVLTIIGIMIDKCRKMLIIKVVK